MRSARADILGDFNLICNVIMMEVMIQDDTRLKNIEWIREHYDVDKA
ncbi:MAG: hypothetical protein ACYDEJ_11280 [Desulfitobacteriaceae bacterium]